MRIRWIFWAGKFKWKYPTWRFAQGILITSKLHVFVHFLLVLLKMSDKIHKLCGWRIGGVVSMDRRVATMITRQLRQAEKYKDNCLWFERDVDWSTTWKNMQTVLAFEG
jgi:hypothetical protein